MHHFNCRAAMQVENCSRFCVRKEGRSCSKRVKALQTVATVMDKVEG